MFAVNAVQKMNRVIRCRQQIAALEARIAELGDADDEFARQMRVLFQNRLRQQKDALATLEGGGSLSPLDALKAGLSSR